MITTSDEHQLVVVSQQVVEAHTAVDRGSYHGSCETNSIYICILNKYNHQPPVRPLKVASHNLVKSAVTENHRF